MSKNSKKLIKIDNTDGENLYFLLLNNLRNSNEIFREAVTSDNVKNKINRDSLSLQKIYF